MEENRISIEVAAANICLFLTPCSDLSPTLPVPPLPTPFNPTGLLALAGSGLQRQGCITATSCSSRHKMAAHRTLHTLLTTILQQWNIFSTVIKPSTHEPHQDPKSCNSRRSSRVPMTYPSFPVTSSSCDGSPKSIFSLRIN